MVRSWDREILGAEGSVQKMWDFFTDPLCCFLDNDSVDHILHYQSHLVRMYYLFVLISVTPIEMGFSGRFVIKVRNVDYLLHNLECIQKYNPNLIFECLGDEVRIFPLPIIFRIGDFLDRNTYLVPSALGGKNFAYSLFADD